ncbi:hypothetical protein F5883DRAFT_541356 [Diaporthe sp. PMI_573]|nr:hypothetical protein F5883DRAFT_541356 [Diaporthaceae sp. PMI_573]
MCQDPVRRSLITLIIGVSLSAAGLKTQISERSARAVMVRPARPMPAAESKRGGQLGAGLSLLIQSTNGRCHKFTHQLARPRTPTGGLQEDGESRAFANLRFPAYSS